MHTNKFPIKFDIRLLHVSPPPLNKKKFLAYAKEPDVYVESGAIDRIYGGRSIFFIHSQIHSFSIIILITLHFNNA